MFADQRGSQGPERKRAVRLPDENAKKEIRLRLQVDLHPGEQSLTIAAALEDGHTAWSGPVHLDRNHDNSFAVRARQVSAIRFSAASGSSERAEAAPAWLDDDDRSRTALRLYRGSRDHGGRLYRLRKKLNPAPRGFIQGPFCSAR